MNLFDKLYIVLCKLSLAYYVLLILNSVNIEQIRCVNEAVNRVPGNVCQIFLPLAKVFSPRPKAATKRMYRTF